jgi:hypothetical protein
MTFHRPPFNVMPWLIVGALGGMILLALGQAVFEWLVGL